MFFFFFNEKPKTLLKMGNHASKSVSESCWQLELLHKHLMAETKVNKARKKGVLKRSSNYSGFICTNFIIQPVHAWGDIHVYICIYNIFIFLPYLFFSSSPTLLIKSMLAMKKKINKTIWGENSESKWRQCDQKEQHFFNNLEENTLCTECNTLCANSTRNSWCRNATFLHPSIHLALARSGMARWGNPYLPRKRAEAMSTWWLWTSRSRAAGEERSLHHELICVWLKGAWGVWKKEGVTSGVILVWYCLNLNSHQTKLPWKVWKKAKDGTHLLVKLPQLVLSGILFSTDAPKHCFSMIQTESYSFAESLLFIYLLVICIIIIIYWSLIFIYK